MCTGEPAGGPLVASTSQAAISHRAHPITGRNGLIDKYFYLFASLLFAAIVAWGFSYTVNQNLFHAAPPRPLLLWFHGAAFSSWVLFYIFQSMLVRTRNVKVHRFLGWFGAGLASVMVVLGFVIAVIMARFDWFTLHETGTDIFLSIPWGDMFEFGPLVALAILWRKKPELHRRLLFIATCCLLDAPFGRNDYIFYHNLYYVCVDAVILLGVARDLLVDHRIHKVYRVALPVLIAWQAFLVYLYVGAPAWWHTLTSRIIA
jgi:FtsH-binding integral membrane protein